MRYKIEVSVHILAQETTSVYSPMRPDSVHSDFGALQIIYLLI